MELRDRLRSLKGSGPRPPSRPPVPQAPLPYLLPLETEHGIAYYCDKIYIDYHGQIDLKNYPDLTNDALRFLSLDRTLSGFRIRDTVFLDIETTGTAGGAGTIAFLVGLGFVEDGYFQIRQYFLHDLAQEAPFLRAIADFTQRFRNLITYNGKCFDAQVLRTRYLLHRKEDPFEEKSHIDMLFIARRLWKRRFRDCDLMNLERNVLGFHRSDDIPSFLIPGAYTDYLRFARSELIRKVMEHNLWDIASLAVLTAHACRFTSVEEGLMPEEYYSLSLLHERHREYAAAARLQLEALRHPSGLRRRIVLSLSRNLRRLKDRDRMRWLLDQVDGDIPDAELSCRLVILCEHDLRDYRLALRFTEMQIRRLEKYRGIARETSLHLKEWIHRRDRLRRKLLLDQEMEHLPL